MSSDSYEYCPRCHARIPDDECGEGTGVLIGHVRTFDAGVLATDSKAAACKVLEEASEVREAWSAYHDAADAVSAAHARLKLADELADVVQAACNLASSTGVDLRAALDRCEQRNRDRGRITV